jgi:hypothetical protein
MPDYSYILFNKDPDQLRRQGARGGRTFGRNQRARRARLALLPMTPPAVTQSAAPSQTTAEAIAFLDAQFPWLQRAEKRTSGKREHPGHSHIEQ